MTARTIVTVGPTAGIFTPPASCQSLWTFEANSVNFGPGGLLIQNAGGVSQDTDCYPSSVQPYERVSHVEFFSPGYCPQGYSTPKASTTGGATLIICCRSSFTYATTMNPTSGAILLAGCISTFTDDNTVVPYYLDANYSTLGLTSVTGPLSMWSQPMQFAYEKKDLSLFVTSSTTASNSTSSTAQPSPTVAPPAVTTTNSVSASENKSSPAGSGSLSGGAAAGIGIGSALAVVLVAALAFLLFRRKRSKRRTSDQPTRSDTSMMMDAADQPRNGNF